MELKDFQKRVVIEKAELDDKIRSLQRFVEGSIYPTLPVQERVDLDNQLNAMSSYSAILKRRINRFPIKF